MSQRRNAIRKAIYADLARKQVVKTWRFTAAEIREEWKIETEREVEKQMAARRRALR